MPLDQRTKARKPKRHAIKLRHSASSMLFDDWPMFNNQTRMTDTKNETSHPDNFPMTIKEQVTPKNEDESVRSPKFDKIVLREPS